MATYSLPNSADCCESDGTLKCPEVECGSCEESDDCPLVPYDTYLQGGKPRYGYYYYCPPPTDGTEHGMEEPFPLGCWDVDQFASRVWLYGTTCVQESWFGQTYWQSNNVPIAGPLIWDQDECAYLGSGYELRGVDPVNGKRFESDDLVTWNLVDDLGSNLDLAAPTLKLPDGTMRYTSDIVALYDSEGYEYYMMGETVFINTDDTSFVDNGTNFDGPDWLQSIVHQTISVDFRNYTNPGVVLPIMDAPTFCNNL